MKRWMLPVAAAVAVAAVLIGMALIAGFDDDDDDGDTNGPITVDPSELVAATDGSLAAVALEHVDAETSYFDPLYREDGRYAEGTVGADIRFDSDGEYDGDLLRLTAAPGRDRPSCEFGECAEIATDAGTVTLFWEEMVPESDPGIVAVSLQRDGAFLRAYAAGPNITGDPRELDLQISVDVMIAIVTDPRFGLRTTPEMVEAGKDLPGL